MMHRGSCHCGAVAFEVDVAEPLVVQRCTNPDGVDVNVNCLDPVPTNVVIEPFDGQDWENNAAALAHLSKENP